MITDRKNNKQGYVELMGLSTDTKPTDVDVNSIYLELDTGDFYYFDGSDWNEIGG